MPFRDIHVVKTIEILTPQPSYVCEFVPTEKIKKKRIINIRQNTLSP